MVWSQVKGEVGRQYDLSTTMVIVKQREMVWSQVKGEVGRQYDLSTTMVIVKQRLEADFEHLNADTTGRIENLYAHVRKIEKEYMEADDNEEYSNSEEDDAASDMSDSDVVLKTKRTFPILKSSVLTMTWIASQIPTKCNTSTLTRLSYGYVNVMLCISLVATCATC